MEERAAANRLCEELHRCGVPQEDISVCRLAGDNRARPEPSLARVEGYEPPPAPRLIATGHFEWGLKGAMTARTSGAVTRVLAAMGVPREGARRYEVFVRDGWVLLSVFCQEPLVCKKAKMALQRSDAREAAQISKPAADAATLLLPIS